MHLRITLLLLLPHLQYDCQILIPRSVRLHPVQRLAQKLLHIHVPTLSQQILDRRRKLDVQVARERMTRVVDEDARQHDGVVMHIPRGRDGVRQQLADSISGLFGGTRTRFGRFDDGRQMDVVGALLCDSTWSVSFPRTERGYPAGHTELLALPPDSQNADCST